MVRQPVSCSAPSDVAKCALADEAASAAARKVFAILGVDLDEPKEVEAFRRDLRFGGSMRRAADRMFLAFVLAIGSGIAAALWVGIVERIKGG